MTLNDFFHIKIIIICVKALLQVDNYFYSTSSQIVGTLTCGYPHMWVPSHVGTLTWGYPRMWVSSHGLDARKCYVNISVTLQNVLIIMHCKIKSLTKNEYFQVEYYIISQIWFEFLILMLYVQLKIQLEHYPRFPTNLYKYFIFLSNCHFLQHQ